MSEYRDPRVDPRAGDILRIDEFAVEVVAVDARVEARDTANNEWVMPLDEWRAHAHCAAVLWQDDAPPPADVALLAAANRTLAERVERAERERDEARRVLLALAEGCRSAHDYEMRTARPRDLEAPGRILKALHDALGLSDDTLWGDMAAALRRLCGVSDG